MASIEREVENALLNVVSGVTGVNFFTSERGTARTMPSVTVQAQIGSEELVPFSGVFKTPTTITYVARADTTARADFDAKFYDILEQLYRDPDLASYLTSHSNMTFYVAKVTGDSPAVISQNRTWSRAMTLDITATATKIFSPLNISGLSLWLKADAGVSKFSYNYASTIVISGTSNPSFAGTYTADSVPTWDYVNERVNTYSLTGPTGKSIYWDTEEFLLSSTGEPDYSFASSNGVNWTASSYIAQIVITGFTGVYSGANGTYNGNGNYFTRVGGGFYIDADQLKDTASEILIATAPVGYSGSWTPTSYESSVTLTNAGTTSVNGIYTRSDSLDGLNSFSASGGRIIYYDSGWFTGGTEYFSNDLRDWIIENGDSPAPSASVGTSARSVGTPTSTASSKPTGSISGSVTNSTVNTDNVTGWADQSGNGRNAAQQSETVPTYSLVGGKSFVIFGSYINMSVPTIWDNVQFVGTIITVAHFASSDDGILLSQESEFGLFEFGRGYASTNAPYIQTSENDPSDTIVSSSDANNNTNYVIGTTFNGSSASLYLNGASVGTGSVNSNTGTYNTSIGGASSIAEMIVYDRVLTTPERQQVEAYLNSKYAIY